PLGLGTRASPRRALGRDLRRETHRARPDRGPDVPEDLDRPRGSELQGRPADESLLQEDRDALPQRRDPGLRTEDLLPPRAARPSAPRAPTRAPRARRTFPTRAPSPTTPSRAATAAIRSSST